MAFVLAVQLAQVNAQISFLCALIDISRLFLLQTFPAFFCYDISRLFFVIYNMRDALKKGASARVREVFAGRSSQGSRRQFCLFDAAVVLIGIKSLPLALAVAQIYNWRNAL